MTHGLRRNLPVRAIAAPNPFRGAIQHLLGRWRLFDSVLTRKLDSGLATSLAMNLNSSLPARFRTQFRLRLDRELLPALPFRLKLRLYRNLGCWF